MLIDLCEGSNEVGALCGRILGAGAVLQTAGQRALACREETYTFLSKGLKDEREAVKSAACRYPIFLSHNRTHNHNHTHTHTDSIDLLYFSSHLTSMYYESKLNMQYLLPAVR